MSSEVDDGGVTKPKTVPDASPPEAPVLSPGQILKDRYLIETELGRGGFGVVYLARDQQLLSKPVVVKVLLGEASRDTWVQKKFHQEIEALARIDHPGVVGILDVGTTPAGQPFLVMQFVEGVTLRSVIPSGGMDLARAAHIVRQIGQALGAAHEKGVFHRDLKPENVMLLRAGKGEEYVKLIDFGIATVKHSRVAAETQSTKIAGSFAYMAPEQLMGQPTAASDVYSFGVLSCEMLTGQRPEVLPQGVKVKPRDLRPGLPEAAQQAVLKALSFHPEERFAGPREFGEELAGALGETPTQQAPVPAPPDEVPGPEVAHVLFLDLVGCSAHSLEEQTRLTQMLQEIVRGTPDFQRAQASDQLICLPTSGGMAVVFFQNPAAAVQCAVETAHAVRSHPELKLRMGVHTGPLPRIADMHKNLTVSGGGIDLAQRVMDFGDAGHILISKSVADVLRQSSGWAECLHDLGEQEIKPGVKVHLVNLYAGQTGNPQMPEKLRARQAPQPQPHSVAPQPPASQPQPATPPPYLPPARSHRGLYMLAGAVLTLVIIAFSATEVANWRKAKAVAIPAPATPREPAQSSVPPPLQEPAAAAPVAPPVQAPTSSSQQPAQTSPPIPTQAPETVRQPHPRQAVEASPARTPPRQAPTPPPQRSPVSAQPLSPPPAAAPPAAGPPVTAPALTSQGPAGSSAQTAALQEQRERMLLLAARVGAVRSSMQTIERQQNAAGLSMRSDMVAANQRVEYLMGEANTSLAAADPATAKRNLDLAERDVEKLERFLGK